MAEPCGCTWDDNRDTPSLKPEIIYCPMHAAAGDMLAALEKVQNMPLLMTTWEKSSRDAAYNEIQAVLAAARSGAPRPDVLGDVHTALAAATGALEGVRDGLSHQAPTLNRIIAESNAALEKVAQARGGA